MASETSALPGLRSARPRSPGLAVFEDGALLWGLCRSGPHTDDVLGDVMGNVLSAQPVV